jgi:hypothetical protein
MPVQAAVFMQYKIIMGYFVPVDHECNDNDKNKADNNMQGMKSGHEKIKTVEKNISLSAQSKDL